MTEYMRKNGATAEDITQAQRDLAQGQGFDGVQPANEFIKAWGEAMVAEAAGLGIVAGLGRFGLWVGKGEQAAKATGNPVVDAEKAALDRIAQNPKSPDLAGKQPGTVLQTQSQKRIDDLAVQYNTKSIEPKDFQLNLGGKVLKTDPQVSKGAPVYMGATTSDVMSYFRQLAGVENMPAAKVIPGKGQYIQPKLTPELE
ncbi:MULTISPECIES: hypothetical protein [Pseudomonas aeruginosa group]|nr:hypothetical protein [Pseudomonas aeruginosa]MCX3378123.1 hypothetical protein [Pseudomonas aeruginosa]MDG3638654.1 hypothetical protein [Pseudomonas aeruginosa]